MSSPYQRFVYTRACVVCLKYWSQPEMSCILGKNFITEPYPQIPLRKGFVCVVYVCVPVAYAHIHAATNAVEATN